MGMKASTPEQILNMSEEEYQAYEKARNAAAAKSSKETHDILKPGGLADQIEKKAKGFKYKKPKKKKKTKQKTWNYLS